MQLCRNHLSTSLQLLRCTKNIEKPREVFPIRPLPKSTKLNTIVFDLDETLIHCNENIDIPHDTLLSIVFPNGESTKAGINVRPYAI
jgi:CTD small phosphatase-like protein 2